MVAVVNQTHGDSVIQLAVVRRVYNPDVWRANMVYYACPRTRRFLPGAVVESVERGPLIREIVNSVRCRVKPFDL